MSEKPAKTPVTAYIYQKITRIMQNRQVFAALFTELTANSSFLPIIIAYSIPEDNNGRK